MFLPIYLYGHPILREQTQDITADYPQLKELIANMYETMYESDGVGLAAPQIGKAIRLLVIDGTPVADTFPECEGLKRTFINAKIEEFDGKEVSEVEGCLSIPGISESVTRPSSIVVSYVDEEFQPHREEFHGYAARIIQHEYDHLEGTLFTDRVSPFRKKIIKRKLAKIEEGFTVSRYPYVSASKRSK